MAFNLRNRRVAFDNIAAGSATGRERTVAGSLPSTELYGGGTGTAGATAMNHSNIAAGEDVTSTNPEHQASHSSFSGVNGAVQGGSTDQNTTIQTTSENCGSSNTVGFVTNP